VEVLHSLPSTGSIGFNSMMPWAILARQSIQHFIIEVVWSQQIVVMEIVVMDGTTAIIN
jgi:hypothetical protein